MFCGIMQFKEKKIKRMLLSLSIHLKDIILLSSIIQLLNVLSVNTSTSLSSLIDRCSVLTSLQESILSFFIQSMQNYLASQQPSIPSILHTVSTFLSSLLSIQPLLPSLSVQQFVFFFFLLHFHRLIAADKSGRMIKSLFSHILLTSLTRLVLSVKKNIPRGILAINNSLTNLTWSLSFLLLRSLK